VWVRVCEWECVSESVWVRVCEWECVSESVWVRVCKERESERSSDRERERHRNIVFWKEKAKRHQNRQKTQSTLTMGCALAEWNTPVMLKSQKLSFHFRLVSFFTQKNAKTVLVTLAKSFFYEKTCF